MAALCLPAAAQNQNKDENSSALAPDGAGWEARLKSMEETEALNESEAVKFLIQGLEAKNSLIRMEAAKALGNHDSAESIYALIQVLGDENSTVADQAELSLMKIGKLAVDPLILALGHENPIVRANAAQVLGRLGDPIAIEPLRQLQMESNDSETQTNVAYALRKLDWKEQGTS